MSTDNSMDLRAPLPRHALPLYSVCDLYIGCGLSSKLKWESWLVMAHIIRKLPRYAIAVFALETFLKVEHQVMSILNLKQVQPQASPIATTEPEKRRDLLQSS